MPDPHISKLARALVHYSVQIQKGRQVLIRTNPIADELTPAMYEESVKPGARYLGEWGIGTNCGIQCFTENVLFDEKIGGTIHFAICAGFPESGSKIESRQHWELLCDMFDGETTVDGDLSYKDGHPVIQ